MLVAILFILAILIFILAAAITWGRTNTIDWTDIGLAFATLAVALVLGAF